MSEQIETDRLLLRPFTETDFDVVLGISSDLETVAGVKPTVKTSDGRMHVTLPKDSGHDAQVILQTMRQGLRDLAEEYSRYILLNEL